MSDVESEEMQLFRESVRRMVAREVAPIAARIDEEDEFPREILDIFGDMGLLQILVPESYGGPGGTITMSCVAKEEVAKHSLALSGLVGGTSIGCVASTPSGVPRSPSLPRTPSRRHRPIKLYPVSHARMSEAESSEAGAMVAPLRRRSAQDLHEPCGSANGRRHPSCQTSRHVVDAACLRMGGRRWRRRSK